MPNAVAVLDIGKTNVKVALFGADGALLFERSAPNRTLPGPPYPHADVEAIWAFLVAALREAARDHDIATIVATTHGCAGAFIDDAGLTLPVLDYEFAGVESIELEYAALRPPYRETLSPPLPGGLNQGKQIAWQIRRFPGPVAKSAHYLTYPQYWAWRLSGVAASEVTMLGAHSDLWNPVGRRASSLVAKLGLERLMPPFRPAWAALGPIKPEIAALTGLSPATQVLNGVHDSNASLLPHLATRKPPFTIVSTGTWVILMAVGLGVERLNAADDMLANVDVEGRPTACARFMGGREYAEIAGPNAGAADLASVERVIASGVLALPCFAPQGGPFAARKGEIVGEVAAGDRAALASLYAALMTDLQLTRLGADKGDLIVEGSFAGNDAFCAVLAALRPGQAVLAGGDAAGTARGAALLATWPGKDAKPSAARPNNGAEIAGLAGYKANWLNRIA